MKDALEALMIRASSSKEVCEQYDFCPEHLEKKNRRMGRSAQAIVAGILSGPVSFVIGADYFWPGNGPAIALAGLLGACLGGLLTWMTTRP